MQQEEAKPASFKKGVRSTTRKALLVCIGLLMILGGLFLLFYTYRWNEEFPYSYVLVKTGRPEDFPEFFSELKIYGRDEPHVNKYEIRVVEGNKPVGIFHTVEEEGFPPVVIDYQINTSIPVLMLPVKHEVYKTLYREIIENTGEDSLILSWWDHALRINLFTGRETLIKEFLGEPIFIPETWDGYRKAILDHEMRFWGINPSHKGRERFKKFLEAMLSSEEEGYRILKDLTNGKTTYVVIDLNDILKISEMAGERFQVGFKDFNFTGNIHGTIKRVKNWLNNEGLESYTVKQINKNIVRVYYLPRPEDKNKLIVRLLHFTSSSPFKMEHFKIRYQKSTIWIYELL